MDSVLELLDLNTPTRLLAGLGLSAAVFLALELARRLLIRRLQGVAAASEGAIDDLLLRMARGTFFVARLMFALWVGSWTLHLPELGVGALGRVGVAMVAVQLGRWGGAVIDTGFLVWGRRAEAQPSSQAANVLAVLRALTRGAWWTGMALLVLENLGVDLAPVLTGLGVGGVALALAVQSVVGDLLRSLTILFDRPASVGEHVVIGDIAGRVETIGIRSTRIRALSGEEVVVPNADLVTKSVRNFKVLPEELTTVRLLALLTTPAERFRKLPELARAAVGEAPGATFVSAGIAELGQYGVVLEIRFHPAGSEPATRHECRQEVFLSLLRLLQDSGIQLTNRA